MTNGHYPTTLREEAFDLYRQGGLIREIAEMLDVPMGVTHNWLQRERVIAADPDADLYVDYRDVGRLTKLSATGLRRLEQKGQIKTQRRNGRKVMLKTDVVLLQRRVGRNASRRGVG